MTEPIKKTAQEVVEDVFRSISGSEISENDLAVMTDIKMLIADLKGAGTHSKDYRAYSAQELSRVIGSLAVLKSSLADIISKAGRNMRIAEAYIKLRKGNLYEKIVKEYKDEHKKQPTVDYIKSQTNRIIFKDRVKYAFLEEFHEKAIYLWRAANGVIDTTQTRIQVLMSERGDVKLMSDTVEYVGDDQNQDHIIE